MRRNIRRFAIASLMSGAVLVAGQAYAAPITVDSIGDTFTVFFDGNVAGSSIDGLSSEATFTVTDFGDDYVNFSITLENTSGGSVGSRVSALGFNTTPDVDDADITGVFSNAVIGGAFPNEFGDIEVCFTDGNSCQGGGGGGVEDGDSVNFAIELFFDADLDELTFDKFGVRYQSITGVTGGTSGTGTGTVPDIPDQPLTPVPEPASLLLLGGGLAALAVRRFRRRA